MSSISAMMVPRLAAVLLLCALAAGQQEQKTIADFKKPFRIVANLIVDKNFFLLRELTPEEQKTGKVDLEDPFNEKNRPSITPATTTTTTTTTRRRARNKQHHQRPRRQRLAHNKQHHQRPRRQRPAHNKQQCQQ